MRTLKEHLMLVQRLKARAEGGSEPTESPALAQVAAAAAAQPSYIPFCVIHDSLLSCNQLLHETQQCSRLLSVLQRHKEVLYCMKLNTDKS